MNNKNKGFSLVELLAVLVVLVVIALIAITSIKNIINKTSEVIDKDKEKQILNAAEKWAIENSDKFDDTEAKNLKVGLDVAFALDFSGSMAFSSNFISTSSGRISRYQAMIEALDSALPILLPEGSDNRIAIVSYGKEVKTILPLDQYKTTSSVYVKWTRKSQYSDDYGTISFPNLYNSSGKRITQTYTMSNNVTYTQGGIFGAANVLLNSSSSTKRIPVIILFTDGEPTAYSYGNKYRSQCQSCGGSWDNSAAKAMIDAGVTAKLMVKEHYNNASTFFYTVGLGINSGSPGELVLNPTKENIEAITSDNKRKTLANTLIKANGSDAYGYADKSFINVIDASQLKEVFQTISTEVVKKTEIKAKCVTVDVLYKDGYISNKDLKLSSDNYLSEYIKIYLQEETNQFTYEFSDYESCKDFMN